MPSPLKSAVVMATGPDEVCGLRLLTVNVPSALPSRTVIASYSVSIIAASVMPSPLKSPVAIAFGSAPVGVVLSCDQVRLGVPPVRLVVAITELPLLAFTSETLPVGACGPAPFTVAFSV